MSIPKLFLFDVDGTIVDSGAEIDSNMICVLNSLKKKGTILESLEVENLIKYLNK